MAGRRVLAVAAIMALSACASTGGGDRAAQDACVLIDAKIAAERFALQEAYVAEFVAWHGESAQAQALVAEAATLGGLDGQPPEALARSIVATPVYERLGKPLACGRARGSVDEMDGVVPGALACMARRDDMALLNAELHWRDHEAREPDGTPCGDTEWLSAARRLQNGDPASLYIAPASDGALEAWRAVPAWDEQNIAAGNMDELNARLRMVAQRSREGRDEYLLTDDVISCVNEQVFVVPAGFVTDFASVPGIVRPVLRRNPGQERFPALLHDWLYAVVEEGDASQWEAANALFGDDLKIQDTEIPGWRRWLFGLGVGTDQAKRAAGRPDEMRFATPATCEHAATFKGDWRNAVVVDDLTAYAGGAFSCATLVDDARSYRALSQRLRDEQPEAFTPRQDRAVIPAVFTDPQANAFLLQVTANRDPRRGCADFLPTE